MIRQPSTATPERRETRRDMTTGTSGTKDGLWARAAGLLQRKKHWHEKDGVYTWQGYGWGIDPPPQTLAFQYFNFVLIEQAIGDRRFERSLEIGCGWGARTPFVARFSSEAHAIEPNEDVLKDARKWLPGINFHHGKAQELPFADDHFDLVVAWTVLQHIPDESIETVAAQIQRVLRDDGTLLLFENTKVKKSKPPIWRRSEQRYEELFAPMERKTSIPRESVSGRKDSKYLMVFE